MPLFIDCYNLLHAAMPPSLAGLDELWLCRLLAQGPWSGDRIVVVCDGSAKPHAPHSPLPQVELLYSGKDRSADDVIRELIDADSAPRRAVVVSDDRQIQKAARRRRCRVIPCADFVHLLAASGPSSARPGPANLTPPTQKFQTMSESEIDHWLKRFGYRTNEPIDPTDQPPWDEDEP